ncbi:MAG: hypothetical protein AB1861_29210 [Cyanobacteriota bacterium]
MEDNFPLLAFPFCGCGGRSLLDWVECDRSHLSYEKLGERSPSPINAPLAVQVDYSVD